MHIGPNTVATFHYTLRDEQGEEMETSRGSEPTAYLHGAGNIITGLEEKLAGKSAGDVLSVTVKPEKAYGLRREGQTQRVPIKHLIYTGKLRAGDVVQLNTSEGRKAVTVIKAGRHSADLDTNHPLSGLTLTFDIEILDVRDASDEEIAHGHAHGIGGHQH